MADAFSQKPRRVRIPEAEKSAKIMNRPRQAYQMTPPAWGVRQTAPGKLNLSMGITAENICDKYGISREECDAFAVESHRRAAEAQAKGYFDEQIAPVPVTDRKGRVTIVSKDECVRPECSMESLGKLPPAFLPEGRVTAGTSSPQSDGSGAVVVMEKERAIRENKKIWAKFVDFVVVGCDPLIMKNGVTEKIISRNEGFDEESIIEGMI